MAIAQQQQQLQAMGYSGMLDNSLLCSQPMPFQIQTSQAQQHLPMHHSSELGGDSLSFLQLHQQQQQQHQHQLGRGVGGPFDPSAYTIPESLAHSSLLSAAFSDPTGSLSHIELGLLSGSPPKPFGGAYGSSPSPPSSSPMTLPMTPVTTGLSLGGHSPFQSSLIVKAEDKSPHVGGGGGGGAQHGRRDSSEGVDVKHPEVGDAIGDGRLSHEDVIAHFRQYALRVGFSMTRNFDNMDGSGRYRRVRVACKQGGMPRKTTKHENPALQRERTSQKVGCPFEVTIWRTKQRPGGVQSTVEQWIITNVKGICHGPCQLLGGAYHPLSKTHDGIHKDVQDEIKAQLKRTQQAALAASAAPPAAAAAVPQPRSATKKPKLDQKAKTPGASSSAAPSVASPPPLSPQRLQSDLTQTPSRGASPHLAAASGSGGSQPMTLMRFVSSSRSALFPGASAGEFALLLGEISGAGKRIADVLSSPGAASDPGGMASFASQALRNAVASSSGVQQAFSAVLATDPPPGGNETPEEGLGSSRYVVVADPLSGVAAMDAGTPPGTIFAVCSRAPQAGSPERGFLQEGRNLLVAGYMIYSTATMMVLTVGVGTHGFTLDRRTGDFVLTHPNMRVLARSQSYALGESPEGPEQWPGGVKSYVDAIAHGNGQSKRPYVARSASSVVADLHRALLRGGVVLCPPSSRLRLAHAAAPLALLAEQAYGRAIDGGCRSVLEAKPQTLAQTTDLYLGSADDVSELELHLREV